MISSGVTLVSIEGNNSIQEGVIVAHHINGGYIVAVTVESSHGPKIGDLYHIRERWVKGGDSDESMYYLYEAKKPPETFVVGREYKFTGISNRSYVIKDWLHNDDSNDQILVRRTVDGVTRWSLLNDHSFSEMEEV